VITERENDSWAGVLFTALMVAILLVERGTTWERCSCFSLGASWGSSSLLPGAWSSGVSAPYGSMRLSSVGASTGHSRIEASVWVHPRHTRLANGAVAPRSPAALRCSRLSQDHLYHTAHTPGLTLPA
jgi:hypothetical protein